ncbi:hypothetical protein A1OE_339 [Candidatus Endolissoclinum faulkneri L2]|uniref:Uncharacterized protein n=1 Tax=Candidatus Endolissoclinum faulkneri L2 TaxID=1193729 RepID=K7YG11_9PROT|nr:hypothetical protein A1OE_339 [Candidatus Endolissoclinum faulkneri L2]
MAAQYNTIFTYRFLIKFFVIPFSKNISLCYRCKVFLIFKIIALCKITASFLADKLNKIYNICFKR